MQIDIRLQYILKSKMEERIFLNLFWTKDE